MKRDKIYRKLQRIQALESGATSIGERKAAEKAKKRLLLKLESGGILLDTSHLFECPPPSYVADPILSDMPLPTREELMNKIQSWRSGNTSPVELQLWASEIIDKMVLPNPPPDDPESIQVEVIFELSSIDQRTWEPCDIDELHRFLSTAAQDARAAWRRWFSHIEASSERMTKVSA